MPAFVTDTPLMVISPSDTSFRRLMERSRVLFPAPLNPMMETNSPSSIVRLIWSRPFTPFRVCFRNIIKNDHWFSFLTCMLFSSLIGIFLNGIISSLICLAISGVSPQRHGIFSLFIICHIQEYFFDLCLSAHHPWTAVQRWHRWGCHLLSGTELSDL